MKPAPLFLLLSLWLALSGCALSAPTSGKVLRAGPTPVSEALFQVRARHTDLVDVHVLFPSDSEGRPARPADGAPLPALVLVHGGLVPPEDYLWLAESLAARGYVVALPSHPLDLPLSAIDNGHFARRASSLSPEGSLLEGLCPPPRIAVAGHSLGGVVSTKLALDGGFAALALLASYPDSADTGRLPSLSVPSLSLAGELDCSAELPRVREGAALLPSPTVLAVLEGVTHYQFTSSDRPGRGGRLHTRRAARHRARAHLRGPLALPERRAVRTGHRRRRHPPGARHRGHRPMKALVFCGVLLLAPVAAAEAPVLTARGRVDASHLSLLAGTQGVGLGFLLARLSRARRPGPPPSAASSSSTPPPACWRRAAPASGSSPRARGPSRPRRSSGSPRMAWCAAPRTWASGRTRASPRASAAPVSRASSAPEAGLEAFLRTGGPRVPLRLLLGARGRLGPWGLALTARAGGGPGARPLPHLARRRAARPRLVRPPLPGSARGGAYGSLGASTSVTMSVLVRASTLTLPLGDSTPFTCGSISDAFA